MQKQKADVFLLRSFPIAADGSLQPLGIPPQMLSILLMFFFLLDLGVASGHALLAGTLQPLPKPLM